MHDISLPIEIPAVTIGSAVLRCISDSHLARVIAVSTSTFYIAAGDQLICITSRDIGRGPLNIVTAAPSNTNWSASGVRMHMPARISRSQIRVGNCIVIPLSEAELWSPKLTAGEIEPDHVRFGLDVIRKAVVDLAPDDGLGRFLANRTCANCHNLVAHTAAPLVGRGRMWVVHTLTKIDSHSLADLAWVEEMAGLGPGLTPSGDDFLGGMMVALHKLGDSAATELLWQAIEPCVRQDGNDISRAHLAAAAEGMCAEAIERTISAVLRGDCHEIHAGLVGIGQLGHSSGWDTMAGVGTTLDGWLEAQYCNRNH